MPSSATLRVVDVTPPWTWDWRLELPSADPQVSRVRIDPLSAVHQVVVDRSTQGVVPTRSQLREAMRTVVGDEFARWLRTAALDRLFVHSQRACPLALLLPLECLFDDPIPLITRHVESHVRGVGL